MGKSLYIAEKPSVAQEFAKALKMKTRRQDGYLESEDAVVTWCVGHLVTMSYPEAYDPALKRWNLETLPFIPQEFQYEVIPAVAKQFKIVQVFKQGGRGYHLCVHRLRAGRRVYLPTGGTTGGGSRQRAKKGVDRFSNRGRDSSRDS